VKRAKPLETTESDGDYAIGEAEDAINLGESEPPPTELDRLLLAARREFFAAEGRFLNRDELARELAERRGGSAAVGEE
jgi:hypothetical protein